MGMVNVESAMQLLNQALAHLGSTSPEGAAVLRAMGTLSKHFSNPKAKELIPAQLMELMQAQQASPMAGMMQPQAQGQPQGQPQ